MCKFDGPSLKRHLVVSNCEGLIASLVCRAGYCSAEERKTMVKVKLAVHHQNRSGKVRNRFTGIPKLLKQSQLLSSQYDRIVAIAEVKTVELSRSCSLAEDIPEEVWSCDFDLPAHELGSTLAASYV